MLEIRDIRKRAQIKSGGKYIFLLLCMLMFCDAILFFIMFFIRIDSPGYGRHYFSIPPEERIIVKSGDRIGEHRLNDDYGTAVMILQSGSVSPCVTGRSQGIL